MIFNKEKRAIIKAQKMFNKAIKITSKYIDYNKEVIEEFNNTFENARFKAAMKFFYSRVHKFE